MTGTDIVSSSGFELVFRSHFEALHTYASHILNDEDQAKEVVQQVFYKLWKKRETLQVTSITAYLNRAVYNDCMDYFRHQEVRQSHRDYAMGQVQATAPEEKTSLRDMEQKLETVIRTLPPQCRLIFNMSRFEELRYREIAERLGISVKAVEKQISHALKILRTALRDYLPLLIGLFLYF